jgi:hypothetical protein
MLNLAQTMHERLAEDLVLLPVGLDYEDYGSLRRRLRYRIGQPLDWKSWVDPSTGQVPANFASRSIAEALTELMVNVQPAKHYESLNPYVQALRSTEQGPVKWVHVRSKIGALNALTDEQLDAIAAAWSAANAAGVNSEVRAEDLGLHPDELRKGKAWTWVVAPFVLLPNLLNLAVSLALQGQARIRVKDICFVSTFKSAAGMAVYPLVWAGVAAGGAAAFPAPELGGWWTFAFLVVGQTIASRVGVWWYGHWLDERGRGKAKRFWANPKQAKAWSTYLGHFENTTE